MKIKLTVSLREFCIYQFTIISIITALSLFAYVVSKFTGYDDLFGFLRLLDIGSERSFATYVSVVNLLLASILLFIIYYHEKCNKENGPGYWLFLTLIFLLLSVDESAGIHENIGRIYTALVRRELIFPIIFSQGWLPFGLLFVIFVGVVLLKFIRNLPADTRWYFLIAGGIFITGAMGFEYLGHWMEESHFVESRQDWAYLIRRLFEEGFEMYGIALFNCALYREVLRKEISVIVGH